MTPQERDRKIFEINCSSDSTQEKARRVAIVKDYYEKQQSAALTASSKAADQAEANLKDRLRQAYLKADPAATTEGFEKDYPELKSTYLRDQALKQDQAARDASASASRAAF